MAFFNDKKRGQMQGAPANPTMGNTFGMAPGTAAKPAGQQPGGFNNLDTYLNLNQAQGQKMADQVAKPVFGDLYKAKDNMQAGTNAFYNGIQQANQAAKPEASPYNSLGDVSQWSQGKQQLDNASAKAQQLGAGFDQRQSLVNQTFSKGTPDYTTGMGQYDNALASANGGKAFTGAASLANYLGQNANTDLTNSAGAASLQNQYAQNWKGQSGAAPQDSEQQARQRDVEVAASRVGQSVSDYLANNPGAAAYIQTGDSSGWSGIKTIQGSEGRGV